MNDKTQEEILVRKAKLARERLLDVVDQLDRKRHNLQHPLKLVSKHLPEPATAVAIGAAALIAIGAIGFAAAKLSARRKPARRTLFERQPPRPGVWADIASHTARALLIYGLVEAGKYGVRRTINALPANGHMGF